jgi:hypothetical protein
MKYYIVYSEANLITAYGTTNLENTSGIKDLFREELYDNYNDWYLVLQSMGYIALEESFYLNNNNA